MNLTRREALRGTTASLAAIAAGGAATAGAADRDATLRQGVQALVRMIRADLPRNIMGGVFDGLQQAADYLEMLPGIEPVPNESWERWQQQTREFWEFPKSPRLPFSVKRYAWEAEA